MKKKKVFLIFTFISLCVLLCIFNMKGYNHDFSFHMGRIEYIAEEFNQHGISAIPIRIYSAQNNGYGYGTPLFYGEALLYPFALLVSFGFDLLTVSMITYFVFYILNFIIPYLCCKKIFGEDRSATFALLYALSPYLIVNTLQRGALGEIIASAFIPLVLLTFFEILKENKINYHFVILLAISLTIVMNVHTISTLILILFMAIFFITINVVKRDINYFKYTFIPFAISAILFLFLNISYILPLLEQILTYKFKAFNGSGYLVHEQIIDLLTMITSLPDLLIGIIYSIEIKITKGIFYYPAFIMTIYVLINSIKNKEYWQKYKILILSLTILTTLIFWSYPWKILDKIIGFIQFPWRLSTLAYMIIAIILTDMLFNNKFKLNTIKIPLIAYLLVSILYFIFFASYCIIICSTIEPNINDLMGKMALQDYIGADSNYLTEETLQNKIIGYEGDYVINRENNELFIVFNNYDSTKETNLELPIIPYKGYTVIANNNDELEYEIGKFSQMKVVIEEDYELTELHVKYNGTIIQKISFFISITAWIIVLIGLIIFKKENS